MKQLLLLMVGSVAFAGCAPAPGATAAPTAVTAVRKDTPAQPAPASASGHQEEDREIYPSWMDSVMLHYIKNTSNKLVQAALRDSLYEEWLPDQPVQTDSTVYWIFQVGHDMKDQDGLRFVTDGWIYIDTISHQLYEYDLPRERLLPWRGKK